ncbi:type VII secretion target [Rhodococcus chondri]|uniref:Type VII secretion target n=1 Tax=Rhodococcus chondri TaxID=3065941 RepID=A0ABU7JN70_9NOCA|nr:type VII secretion target [Rhodococcus sp. CC-R104]MEE2031329.1 type VII secretion target [Rhodococcus sp. CC-R104]
MTEPGFRVDPDDLRAAAQQLQDLADQSRSARSYADRWLSPDASGGVVFGDIMARLAELRPRLTAAYDELGLATDRASTALNTSAAEYETSRDATARRFDRLHPDVAW